MAFIDVDDGNSLVVYDAYDKRTAIADIGGCWDAYDKVWKVVFTVSNLDSLLDAIPGVAVTGKVEEKLKEQIAKEASLERLRELSKKDATVSLKLDGLKMPLYNYQRLGVMYASTNGVGLLLADEMGLGKSLQGIGAALYLRHHKGAKKVLVVVPASLKFNWPLEIEKFTDEKYVVIDGKPEERVAQWLRNDVLFYIVNYELLQEDLFGGRKLKAKRDETEDQKAKRAKTVAKAKKRQSLLSEVRHRFWDLIIVDECHAIKHHSSQRTRNVKALKGKCRIGLTGTPLDGRLEELHSIMQFVAPGLLMSKTRFFQKHVNTDMWGRVVGYKNVGEVSWKIQPFFLRRLKKDVLKDLPDKVYQNRIVAFSNEEAKIYKSLAESGHEATEDEGALVALIRCKQFCNYPAMVDDDCKANSKLDAFREVVDEAVLQNGHKALVFSQYRTMLDVLVGVLDSLGVRYLRIDGGVDPKDRASMQEKFNTDIGIDVMIGTEAMSTGLNFQSADYVINYDDNWSPAIMAQREDRCHRNGQRNVVNVVNFICKDTIEERIRGVIYAKNKVSAQALGDETEDMILRRLGPKDMAKLL